MAWDDEPPGPISWDSEPPKEEDFSPQLFGKATSTLEKVGNTLSKPFEAIEKIPGYQEAKKQVEDSPLGLGQRLFDAGTSAANKLGEKTAETLSEKGLDLSSPFSPAKPIPVSPEVAARAGTAIQMTPDILGLVAAPPNPTGILKEAPPPLKSTSPAFTEAIKAPPPINLGEEAANILKEPTPPRSTIPPPTESLASKIKGEIPQSILDPMEEVKNYISKEYGQISKKSGVANTAADYLKEHARNMNLKELGAAPGQVRKIGVPRAHALADYAAENDLVGPNIGTIGRDQKLAKSLEDAGGAVGAFRKIASDNGAVHNPTSLIKEIRSQLDSKYLTKGMYQGQKGSYMKALDELKKTDGTAQGMADKVTEMFKEAKNQNPLSKPEGPIADVARQARQINHDLISKHLSPEEMTLYEKSLEDYGALTQIKEFAKRRSSTEAGGRLGPGSGISRAAVQKFLDAFGYRTEAKIANKLSDFIRKNPDVMSRPKDLFRNYIDEAAEAVHEMGNAAH